MQPAATSFDLALRECTLHPFTMPVYSNVSADAVRETDVARLLLVDQLTRPVRWVRLMETMCDDYQGLPVIEMGPGSVLCGLVKRIVPGADCVAVGTVGDVEKFLARFCASDPSTTPQP
jgi:[acyl-carrier-protein] S-malonyltransferase